MQNPPPGATDSAAFHVRETVLTARLAQAGWQATPIQSRLAILGRFRALVAEQSTSLAQVSARQRGRPVEEVLTAEIIPLLEAIRFLERQAKLILAPQHLGRKGRPRWLMGVQAEIHREPLGVILVIGPSNYPIFLPVVQAVQALAAGNAVIIKPGACGSDVMERLVSLLHHAGLDHRLIHVLPEDPSAATSVIHSGVDKVVLTGSAETGESVLGQLAGRLTPAVMELSGCDAVVVRADADLDLTVRALRFGALLNNGATCIAPRRVFVNRSVATELEGRLAQAFRADVEAGRRHSLRREWIGLIEDALANGAHLVSGRLFGDGECLPPLVLAGASAEMQLLQEDVFAPVMALLTVADDHEALEYARRCPYALGASIFSRDLQAAKALAGHLEAGVVVINDMIVPTADPRLPFAGRRRSGFGATRGAEGLLEMTVPKAIACRRTSWLPHLDAAREGDFGLFKNYILLTNSKRFSVRVLAAFRLLGGIFRRQRADRGRECCPLTHS
jgi:acyl-CoA reductase-like NAD-dependent aldehyde dehydrogenase